MIALVKKKLVYFLSHPFTGLGAIVFIGSMSNNVLGYVFNLILSRSLSTSDFGTFSSLNSLTYLLYIPATTLILVTTRWAAERKAKNDVESIRYVLPRYTACFFLFGIAIFFLMLFCNRIILSYLHIRDLSLLIWLDLIFPFIFPLSLLRGTLNGLLRIVPLSINLVIESLGKIIFAIFFLSLGAGVLSGIIPAFLAMIVGYICGLFVLRDMFFPKKAAKVIKRPAIPWKRLSLYALPVFLTSFFLNSLYTNDVILVKHFFSAKDAGYYAALALSGKIVFFGSGFLAGLLFPYASFAHAKGESSKHLFIYTVITTTVLAGCITLIFYFIPQFFITVFLGKKYIPVANLLWTFGLFISLLSVINVFLNFFLSTMRLRAVLLPIIATITQAIGIILFHNSLRQVIFVNIIITVVLLLSLMLYSLLAYGKR